MLAKNKIILAVVGFVVVATSAIVIGRNIFHADVAGSVVISGNIYSQETKTALSGVQINLTSTFISESGNSPAPVTATTGADGTYTITAPDSTYTKIYYTKDGFWDNSGTIANSGDLSSMTINLAMKSGYGQEDLQINTLAANKQITFGLSLDPTDNNPNPYREITPNGTSFQESPTNVITAVQDSVKGLTNTSSIPAKTDLLGTLPVYLTGATATYFPENDKYYLFGGRSDNPTAVYEYDRNYPNNLPVTATLPAGTVALNNAASIYIPEISAILVVNTDGNIYLYQPNQNKFFPVGTTIKSKTVKVLRGRHLLYIFCEQADGKTNILSITLPPDVGACKDETCSIGNIVKILNTVPRTQFSPYFYTKDQTTPNGPNDRIFLAGGIENGQVVDTIMQILPIQITTGYATIVNKLVIIQL